MSDKKTLIDRSKINKKKYTFNMEDLYKHAHQWLLWRGYDITEKKYKEKILPIGRLIEINWECTRDLDDYTRFEIKVEWRFIGINDVKAVREDKEVTLQHGEIDTDVTANLIFDYDDKWEESPFLSFLKSFYEKYLYAGTIGRLQNELWREGWEFYNELKAFIELYTYEV